ncbi:leucine-rich repeat protein [Skeletonema marinoi]|uniref:Leucine-rich repeat protein n=1 Tax=Skeletonema marinoi TaxID=267567 RepID=A0AAD8XRT2_9STRA|nr:leucine-rich repeat protein [Skeletonema marinoi]
MERRDYDYYESNVADINLRQITSCEGNAKIIRRLLGGDDTLRHLTLGGTSAAGWFKNYFHVGEGDDLGWLGYFIGKSKCFHHLYIQNLPDGEGREQQMCAFMEGIARSQSIRALSCTNLGDNVSGAIGRALGVLSQLEELSYGYNTLGPNGFAALGTLLKSGVLKLKKLSLFDNDIGYCGVASLANGLKSIGPFLKVLDLKDNFIGNEALSALVAALANCTSLEELDLSINDFSMATAGLGSLSDWLQAAVWNLNALSLRSCGIDDEGLQSLANGATNYCKDLDLSGNNSITVLGLRRLSTSLQSDSCRLENLDLGWMDIGDDGAEVLARGLIGNKVLIRMHLCGACEGTDDDIAITPAGWSAFSPVLCDTSSVNNTYLSNHTIQELWHCGAFDFIDIDEDIVKYLRLNKAHPQYAARCKILMNHAHLDMTPLLQWELKCLPLAVGWFERATICTTLSIHNSNPDLSRRILEESKEVFQSRILTALYEFVRGVPKKVLERRDELALVAVYDDKIAVVEEEKKRIQEDVESRKRKITQLEEENKRLRGIVETVRNALD